jgi:hypothetical protein
MRQALTALRAILGAGLGIDLQRLRQPCCRIALAFSIYLGNLKF